MLREIKKVRQDSSGFRKRWFSDSDCDLFLWEDDGGRIVRFLFTHGKGQGECFVEWSQQGGLSMGHVEDGESDPGRFKMTPVLMASKDSQSLKAQARRVFVSVAGELDEGARDLVLFRLQAKGLPSAPETKRRRGPG